MSNHRYHFPLTLCMMVKNEERIIKRCLDSVKDHISGWVIMDTGSTDETMKVIEEELAGIPGVLFQEPFQDFAYNRSLLLEHGRAFVANEMNKGYLLLLDADHVLEGDFSGVGDADGYLIKLPGYPISYSMPYCVGADIKYFYVSPTHEYLTAHEPFTYEDLDSCTIIHHGDGGTRHEKFDRDLRLLDAAYEQDPNNERTVYYLAQTCEGMGMKDRAIELFTRRTQLGGWDQEVFWSYFKIAELTEKPEDYMAAWFFRPSRLEPIQRAMKILNGRSNHMAALALFRCAPTEPTNDYFFVERWVEEYGFPFEIALASWWTGDKKTAKTIWEHILTLPNVTPDYVSLCESNLKFCEDV